MKPIKSIILVLLLCLLGEATAFAAPAYTKPRRVIQPDGTVLTLIGRGDEFCHFLTTTDGYSVVKGEDGFYHYADLKDGRLVPGAVRAFDVENRVSSEISYLSHKEKFLAPSLSRTAKSLKADAMKRNDILAKNRMRKAAGQKKDYRGLVILVNYNDCKFSRGDNLAANFYNRMMNKDNFVKDLDNFYGPQEYTGSVRDYFIDNSDGQFAPEFDVIGPVTIDESQYYVNAIENSYKLLEKVLRTVDDQVDYTKYDSDGDGEVDMVYVIYAGFSSSYNGNDPRLLWPHAGSVNNDDSTCKNLTLDGVRLGRFACSSELWGWEEDGLAILDGIGVIVHEFSHVLGFMDHYDTSNGYQEHPNTWDVMSAGNYSEDFNRTPVAYNSYEKYTAGFISPLNIAEMDGKTVSLRSTETSSDACILRSYQDNVLFLMENRQHDKWDKYLTGHGLLVWRVDSTIIDYWKYNVLNVTTRACFRLVRACGTQGSFLTGVEDTDYDPFPGTHNITELDNDDDAANLISYDGYPCPVVLRNIKENDGVITFDIEKDDYAKNMPITYELPAKFTANAERREGENWVPASWTVTTRTKGDDKVITNLIPNNAGITSTTNDYSHGVFVNYSYSNETAHTLIINAQRVSLDTDYGTWLCDINNVNNTGTGSMVLTVDRYGIPTFNDPSTQLSFCRLKAKAYMVSLKNLVDELDVYRNITFSEYNGSGDVDAISDIISKTEANGIRKQFDGNRIVIVKDNRKYTISGQLSN